MALSVVRGVWAARGAVRRRAKGAVVPLVVAAAEEVAAVAEAVAVAAAHPSRLWRQWQPMWCRPCRS